MRFVVSFFMIVVFLSSAELVLLLQVAANFGFFVTLFFCILTGVVGGAMVKSQGIQTLKNIRKNLSAGIMPTVEIVSGLILIIIGAFLMVPGFITDSLGMILLIPPVRKRVVLALMDHFKNKITIRTGFSTSFNNESVESSNNSVHEEDIIDI